MGNRRKERMEEKGKREEIKERIWKVKINERERERERERKRGRKEKIGSEIER